MMFDLLMWAIFALVIAGGITLAIIDRRRKKKK